MIGDAGVVRILHTGRAVTALRPGDYAVVFCNGLPDAGGYPVKIFGYDAPGTIGLLAKQTKLRANQLIRLPDNSSHSLQQWAAFSLRYVTAWANWKVAYGCWQLLADGGEDQIPFVWGWGGGVTLAELGLATLWGCQTAMMCSHEQRMRMIEEKGITAIDRRLFHDLNFEPKRYASDPAFRHAYQQAEETFLEVVRHKTSGKGVSILIDFIGLPVIRATLKALGRPGVITTAGWKAGMDIPLIRAIECMNWHIHVHTHCAKYAEGVEALSFAEEKGWLPTVDEQVYDWEDIPQLAHDYAQGELTSYFPIFRVGA